MNRILPLLATVICSLSLLTSFRSGEMVRTVRGMEKNSVANVLSTETSAKATTRPAVAPIRNVKFSPIRVETAAINLLPDSSESLERDFRSRLRLGRSLDAVFGPFFFEKIRFYGLLNPKNVFSFLYSTPRWLRFLALVL